MPKINCQLSVHSADRLLTAGRSKLGDMETNLWIRGPIGRDSATRSTRTGFRSVLVVIPTMTAGTRLFDLLPLVEADFRVQVAFTVPHTTDTWAGLDGYVREQDGLVLPWQQAVRHDWDLVLAASHRHLADLSGPILLVAHGAGALMSRKHSRKAGRAAVPTTGLDRELLTYRGRVLPAAIALTNEAELDALRVRCPEAVPNAVVTGDICLDRMLAGLPFRRNYREALGVPENGLLATVSSTWSRESVFGRMPELCGQLLEEVRPPHGRVAMVLHPQVWAVHGVRQVRAWLSTYLDAGLLLIPPEEGWRAAVIGADWVLGDHGSTTAYAAAVGTPVTMAAWPADLHAGSPGDVIRRCAPALHRDQPLLPQRRVAVDSAEQLRQATSAVISARPGAAAALLRATMYRLLGIREPDYGLPAAPVPLARAVSFR